MAEDPELLTAVIVEADEMSDAHKDNILLVDLKVRLAIINDDLKKGISICQRYIHLYPYEPKYRALLAKLLLKYDASNSTLSGLIYSEELELSSLTQLGVKGGQMSENCFKSAMASMHKMPWNNKVKSSFAASIDHKISALNMKLPTEDIPFEDVDELKNIQKKYLEEISKESENEKLKIWAECGLMRLSNSVNSEISNLSFSKLEEVSEELHLPILATLATIAKEDECLKIGILDVNLTIQNLDFYLIIPAKIL